MNNDDIFRKIYLGNWTYAQAANSAAAIAKATASADLAAASQIMAGQTMTSSAMVGSSAAMASAGAHLDPQTFDPLRVRVNYGYSGATVVDPGKTVVMTGGRSNGKAYAAQQIALAGGRRGMVYGKPCTYTFDVRSNKYICLCDDGSVEYVDPKDLLSNAWQDPLQAQIDRGNNTVACCDSPSVMSEASTDEIGNVKVYYHERFSSLLVDELVNGAIDILKANKHLNVYLLYCRRYDDYFEVACKIDNKDSSKYINFRLTKYCFDRACNDFVNEAKIKARINTDDFIKLRIAYIIWKLKGMGPLDKTMEQTNYRSVKFIDIYESKTLL